MEYLTYTVPAYLPACLRVTATVTLTQVKDEGWLPQHVLLEDSAGRLLACCPLYLKGHSQVCTQPASGAEVPNMRTRGTPRGSFSQASSRCFTTVAFTSAVAATFQIRCVPTCSHFSMLAGRVRVRPQLGASCLWHGCPLLPQAAVVQPLLAGPRNAAARAGPKSCPCTDCGHGAHADADCRCAAVQRVHMCDTHLLVCDGTCLCVK